MIQKKMMLAALAAILLGVCTACNAPQQDKQRKYLTKTKKSMTNKELKEKLTLALEDMKAKAIEMGIQVQRRFGRLDWRDEGNPSTGRV